MTADPMNPPPPRIVTFIRAFLTWLRLVEMAHLTAADTSRFLAQVFGFPRLSNESPHDAVERPRSSDCGDASSSEQLVNAATTSRRQQPGQTTTVDSPTVRACFAGFWSIFVKTVVFHRAAPDLPPVLRAINYLRERLRVEGNRDVAGIRSGCGTSGWNAV
jgi:hypothetical protein